MTYSQHKYSTRVDVLYSRIKGDQFKNVNEFVLVTEFLDFGRISWVSLELSDFQF
jgi:hypothetical protein